MKRLLLLPVLLASLCIVAPANADPIPVFNTGVSGAIGTIDTHWTAGATIVNADPAWGAPIAGSNWISHFAGVNPQTGTPNSPIVPGGAFPQDTNFTQTFSMAGLDPTSASLTIRFMVDNNLQITFNGNVVGGSVGGLAAGSNALFYTVAQGPLVINSGFLAGINTLLFTVRNNEFIEGLNVQISGTANPSTNIPGPVPEPTSIALWAIFGGLGTVAARWSRNNRKKSS